MNVERLNVLFVDDEQRILDGLTRQLRSRRNQWDMRFAASGAGALQMLESQPADIVVSDMRMPGMSGGQLLHRIMLQHPRSVRMVLSGQTDQADLFLHLGCIHQYLQKPCEPATLCHAIERTFSLSKILSQPQLRLAVTRVSSLPPGSECYGALMHELSKEDANISVISDLVSRDPALSVKLMQFVNSAFFGMPRQIGSPHAAAALLGLSTLKSIIVASRLFDSTDGTETIVPELATLWKSSFQIGETAYRLAKLDCASESVQQQSRLAGLLSFIGRAILLTGDPAGYARVLESARRERRSIRECETEIFGTTQDEVTAYAIGLWAFSEELVEATAYQSVPSKMPMARRQHPTTYLHIAKNMRGIGTAGLEDRAELDRAYVESHQLEALVANYRRSAA